MPRPIVPSLSRRQLLAGNAGMAAAALTGPLAADGTWPLADLDRLAAEQAAGLASGREVRLRLLVPDGSQGNVEPVIGAFKAMSGIDVEVVIASVDDINSKRLTRAALDGSDFLARLPVPRCQVFEPVDFVIGQAVQEIGDIGLGIEVVGLCSLDDGHDGGGVFSTTVGASKHPILPTNA